MHSNNQYWSNRLSFWKGYKNDQNKNCGIKADEGCTYERCNDYTTTGYYIVIDEKDEVIEIRNENATKVLILR